jgi:nucleosome binding factor SPN SPT16 subunit
MGDEVKIDKTLFQERLGLLISAWKSDKRSNDAIFGGVGSIAITLGKAEDAVYQKSNALHVSRVASRRSPGIFC